MALRKKINFRWIVFLTIAFNQVAVTSAALNPRVMKALRQGTIFQLEVLLCRSMKATGNLLSEEDGKKMIQHWVEKFGPGQFGIEIPSRSHGSIDTIVIYQSNFGSKRYNCSKKHEIPVLTQVTSRTKGPIKECLGPQDGKLDQVSSPINFPKRFSVNGESFSQPLTRSCYKGQIHDPVDSTECIPFCPASRPKYDSEIVLTRGDWDSVEGESSKKISQWVKERCRECDEAPYLTWNQEVLDCVDDKQCSKGQTQIEWAPGRTDCLDECGPGLDYLGSKVCEASPEKLCKRCQNLHEAIANNTLEPDQVDLSQFAAGTCSFEQINASFKNTKDKLMAKLNSHLNSCLPNTKNYLDSLHKRSQVSIFLQVYHEPCLALIREANSITKSGVQASINPIGRHSEKCEFRVTLLKGSASHKDLFPTAE